MRRTEVVYIKSIISEPFTGRFNAGPEPALRMLISFQSLLRRISPACQNLPFSPAPLVIKAYD